MYSWFTGKEKRFCTLQNLLWNIAWADISRPVGTQGRRHHNFPALCSPVLCAWQFCSPHSRLQLNPPLPPLAVQLRRRSFLLSDCFDVCSGSSWSCRRRWSLQLLAPAEPGPLSNSETWTVWTKLKLQGNLDHTFYCDFPLSFKKMFQFLDDCLCTVVFSLGDHVSVLTVFQYFQYDFLHHYHKIWCVDTNKNEWPLLVFPKLSGLQYLTKTQLFDKIHWTAQVADDRDKWFCLLGW